VFAGYLGTPTTKSTSSPATRRPCCFRSLLPPLEFTATSKACFGLQRLLPHLELPAPPRPRRSHPTFAGSRHLPPFDICRLSTFAASRHVPPLELNTASNVVRSSHPYVARLPKTESIIIIHHDIQACCHPQDLLLSLPYSLSPYDLSTRIPCRQPDYIVAATAPTREGAGTG